MGHAHCPPAWQRPPRLHLLPTPRCGREYNCRVLELYLSLFCPVDLTTRPVIPAEQVVVEDFNVTCHRPLLLEHVFEKATASADTDEARVRAWAAFLHRRFEYPPLPPIDDRGEGFFDPLWLLQNGLAHCGQINRVLVDGLEEAGIRARLIQLHNHVAAEVFLDGRWRFIDAYALADGQMVRTATGELASTLDIHQDPSLLKSVTPAIDPAVYAATFRLHTYGTGMSTPYVIRKEASWWQLDRRYYGWNRYKLCTYDGRECRTDTTRRGDITPPATSASR